MNDDGTPHYRNKVLNTVAEKLDMAHLLSVAHSLYTDGTVKRINRAFGLSVLNEWRPPCVRRAFNSAIRERLDMTPFQLMTESTPRTGISVLAGECAQGWSVDYLGMSPTGGDRRMGTCGRRFSVGSAGAHADAKPARARGSK